jgi:hypothetical protein
MKIKTSELTGHALNWAVAQAEGDKVYRPRLGRPCNWDKEAYLKDGSDDRWVVRVQNPKVGHFVDWTYNPSGDWMQGGPIIEREEIELTFDRAGETDTLWRSEMFDIKGVSIAHEYGPTPLIAAMRCFVASRLGDEVDVPDDVLSDMELDTLI